MRQSRTTYTKLVGSLADGHPKHRKHLFTDEFGRRGGLNIMEMVSRAQTASNEGDYCFSIWMYLVQNGYQSRYHVLSERVFAPLSISTMPQMQ